MQIQMPVFQPLREVDDTHLLVPWSTPCAGSDAGKNAHLRVVGASISATRAMVPRMEPSLIDAFKQNPLFFLIAGLFGGLGLALSLLGLILASRGSKIGIVIGLVAVLSGFGALGSGVVGWVMARNMV